MAPEESFGRRRSSSALSSCRLAFIVQCGFKQRLEALRPLTQNGAFAF